MIIPVVMQSTVTGEEVIDAMDLRAFGVGPRTWLDELHYQFKDRVLIWSGVGLLLLSLVLTILGYGAFWVPKALIRWAGG